MPLNERVEKVLVVGCGSIGLRHLRNLRALGVRHLYVVDPDAARRDIAVLETEAVAHETLQAGLAEHPDAVLICSPTNMHVPDATMAANEGCHIFVEKPLSHAHDGIEALLNLAQRNRLTTMVGCNMRFHPGLRAVKGLLDAGAVGRPIAARLHTGSYLPRWRPHQDYRASYSSSRVYGGAVLDCVHEVDLALWYFGDARLIFGCTIAARSISLDVDGLAEALLLHRDGTLTSVHLNFIQRDYQRECHVVGTKGSLHWHFSDGMVERYGEDGEVAQRLAHPAELQVNDMYIEELRHFLSAVADGQQTCNPLAHGFDAMALCLQIRKNRVWDC